jgi:hypothetical protein
MRQILEKCWEQNVEIHNLFIDFQAANYTIWTMEIWSEKHNLDFPNKCAKLCRILNNKMYAKVKRHKHLSSEFKVNKGLRQGDEIATLPLNLLLETAIRRSKVETWGTIFDKCSKLLHMIKMWL